MESESYLILAPFEKSAITTFKLELSQMENVYDTDSESGLITAVEELLEACEVVEWTELDVGLHEITTELGDCLKIMTSMKKFLITEQRTVGKSMRRARDQFDKLNKQAQKLDKTLHRFYKNYDEYKTLFQINQQGTHFALKGIIDKISKESIEMTDAAIQELYTELEVCENDIAFVAEQKRGCCRLIQFFENQEIELAEEIEDLHLTITEQLKIKEHMHQNQQVMNRLSDPSPPPPAQPNAQKPKSKKKKKKIKQN